MSKPKELVKRRPAETAGITLSAAVAGLVALFGWDLSPGQVAGLVTLLGLVPGVITWWRTR